MEGKKTQKHKIMTTIIQDQSKIVDKIKRLFRLSASPNENEAVQAATKAQQLLLQHNLSMSDIYKEDGGETVEYEVEIFLNIPMWKRSLTFGVATSNLCVPIVKKEKDGDGRFRKRVLFVGRQENVVVAGLLYVYLKNEVDRLSKLTKDTSLTYRTSFKLGCAKRVSQRLAENYQNNKKYGIKTSPSENVSALVVSDLYQKNADEIQLYLEKENIKKGRKIASKIQSNVAAAYYEGVEAGNKISLNKQIG